MKTNAGLLSTVPLGSNLSENLAEKKTAFPIY